MKKCIPFLCLGRAGRIREIDFQLPVIWWPNGVQTNRFKMFTKKKKKDTITGHVQVEIGRVP